MKKLSILPLAVLLAAAVPFGTVEAGDITISGTFSGALTETLTDITCDPNASPVTLTGWVEVTGVQANGAMFFGLVDIGLIDSGYTGWGSGAYLYLGRIGSNVRIGPSDGFYYGEINQVGANVPYLEGGPNQVNFSMVIDYGSITVTYGGADYVDDYGEIEAANYYDAYPGPEFDSGAYVAINSWPPLNSVDYEITISGCEGGVTEAPIDIKPGSDPNSINCNNEKEVIAVAILTTEDFDATTVDHTTVTFEGASETHVDKKTGEPRRHEEDVDGDGDMDLVFHFRLGDTALTCASTEGTLTGETFDGQPIMGTDTVRMIDIGGGRP